MKIKRKREEITEDVRVPDPPLTDEPIEGEDTTGSNGKKDFTPASTPNWMADLVSQQGVQIDINDIIRLIASPEGEQRHVFSDIMPHQVIEMMRMDVDDWLANYDDIRTPQEVIRDSYCKWRRAVNRELIKDMHKIFAHYPTKEDEGDKGLIP